MTGEFFVEDVYRKLHPVHVMVYNLSFPVRKGSFEFTLD